MTAGLAQLLALSPRQRARGQIEHSDAGNVQRGQRCGCVRSRLRLLVSYGHASSLFCAAGLLTRPLPAYAPYSTSRAIRALHSLRQG